MIMFKRKRKKRIIRIVKVPITLSKNSYEVLNVKGEIEDVYTG